LIPILALLLMFGPTLLWLLISVWRSGSSRQEKIRAGLRMRDVTPLLASLRQPTIPSLDLRMPRRREGRSRLSSRYSERHG